MNSVEMVKAKALLKKYVADDAYEKRTDKGYVVVAVFSDCEKVFRTLREVELEVSFHRSIED